MTRNERKRSARRRLADLLEGDGDFDLLEAALLVAAEEYPDLEVTRECSRVRFLAAEGARRVEELTNPFARLDGLRVFLFEELGFRGNSLNYNDPRNSYLNEVLNRRLGIPLTLSLLFMEVAEAGGFRARGVALPGHFAVRLDREGRTVFVDPFHGARVITEEDCARLVAQTTGRPRLFRRSLLEGAGDRAILGRLLLNLKHVYIQQKDYGRALAAVERRLLLDPADAGEIRDRGLLKAHLGRAGAAIADLERYLSHAPEAEDAASVRGRVAWLRRRVSDLN